MLWQARKTVGITKVIYTQCVEDVGVEIFLNKSRGLTNKRGEKRHWHNYESSLNDMLYNGLMCMKH